MQDFKEWTSDFPLKPVSCPNMMAIGQWGWCPGKSWAGMTHCSLPSNLGMEETWASSHSLSKANRRPLRGKSHHAGWQPWGSYRRQDGLRGAAALVKARTWWRPGHALEQDSVPPAPRKQTKDATWGHMTIMLVSNTKPDKTAQKTQKTEELDKPDTLARIHALCNQKPSAAGGKPFRAF